MQLYVSTLTWEPSTRTGQSWEAERFSDCQQITHILWNLKVHLRVHNNCQLPLTATSWIRSTPHTPQFILFSYLLLRRQVVSFLQFFQAKMLSLLFLLHTLQTIKNANYEVVYCASAIFSSLLSFLLLRTKHSQRRVFKLTHAVLWQSYTPIRNSRKYYSCVYFSLYLFK
jgi:hypothetical protein